MALVRGAGWLLVTADPGTAERLQSARNKMHSKKVAMAEHRGRSREGR